MKIYLLMLFANFLIASLYIAMLIFYTFKRIFTRIKGRFSLGES